MKQLKILSMTLGILFTQFGFGAAGAANNHQANEQLITAAQKGNIERVQAALEAGADVNACPVKSFLQCDSREERTEIARLFLERVADVNACYYHGTALHCASGRGHTEIVIFLLARGADVNATDVLSDTALHIAVRERRAKIVRILLASDVKVHTINKAFQLAVGIGHTDCVRLLLDAGADVNATSVKGDTALRCASREGSPEIVRFLLDAGADVNDACVRGETALYWAALRGDTEIVRLLLDAGADVNVTDCAGHTALHWAVLQGHQACASILRQWERQVALARIFGYQPKTTDDPLKYDLPAAKVQALVRGKLTRKTIKEQCLICMERLNTFPAVKLNCDCRCRYHQICIDQWLAHKNNCPTCRADQ